MISKFSATKIKMTQTWDKNGKRMPITVLKAEPARVIQIKTQEKDGYRAVKLGYGRKKLTKSNKPVNGQLKNLKLDYAPKYFQEALFSGEDNLMPGEAIEIDKVLKPGDVVSIQGVSKGRGFSGVMKRWGFRGGPKTHGQSDRARAPGSIGQGTDPGRVHKGKKMAGHYGVETITIKNLMVVKVAESELWIKGAVPGAINGRVTISKKGEGKFPGLMETNSPSPLISEA